MAKVKNQQTPTTLVSRFDYGILSIEQQGVVQEKTTEIRDRLKRSAQDIWEIGQRLCDVRTALKHGQFEAWLKAEFGWSRRTAYNFINVYESFGNRANLDQIDIATSALYLLAAPSTPVEVRTAVISQAQEVGDKVAHKDIVARLKQGKLAIESTDASPSSIANVIQEASETIEVTAVKTWVKPQEILRLVTRPTVEVPAVPLQVATWYELGDRHYLYCGETRLPQFYDMIPDIRLAIAVTQDEWDHDWLVDMADSLVVLLPEMLTIDRVEQLILLMTQPNEVVVFPWLPDAGMLAVVDRLGRVAYVGDDDLARCQRAVDAVGLKLRPISPNA